LNRIGDGDKRSGIAYNDALIGIPAEVAAEPEPDTRHAYHLYTILIESHATIARDAFLHNMGTRRNIGVGGII